ncbi:exodeoxyribonuclease VII small subunit [Ruminiclostridium sufflavum DSM 19573]|uniref:Exodeoxyribonuclease 7 small subunit n=1 Tax=Ruminiclostridium sufflavum DSM 19573 TaxID=1121337 RepID=A0A318XLG5_9FIRM|nr:exodeoxyribonuclease VII small subunit [Ruminiclostridium sufflavum]PYG86822.1 exodeoxyribonuclease VII small subunit [Ruminiclostridium sufflavum DSM 19573]
MAGSAKKSGAERSFEAAMLELEDIVSKLEKGDTSLEEAIATFQQGIELSRYCAAKLDEAEKKISILLQDKDGNLIEKEFDI